MKLDQERLRRLYPHMEEDFAKRMEQMIHRLPQQKEEEPVKRFVLRTALVWALITVMLCATAYAVISCGLEWYYSDRFATLQEVDPEKYDAIMANLQTDPKQFTVGDELIDIQVSEVSWSAEKNVLVVALTAVPRDGEVYELHPKWNLDPDGCYVGEGGAPEPAEPDVERDHHWLWTENGFGPVHKMVAPGKQLLLLDMQRVYFGGVSIGNTAMDAYVGKDGAVHTVLDVPLTADMAAHLHEMQAKDGGVVLELPFTVTRYTEDDEQLYTGGKNGKVSFVLEGR